MKRTRVLIGNFEQNSCFIVGLIFRLNTLNGIMKVLAMDLLRLHALGDTKTALLTPKRYGVHPRHFDIGISPGELPTARYSTHMQSCWTAYQIFRLVTFSLPLWF